MKFTEGDSVLSKMQEFTAARLSVSKVTEEEWDFIVNELIDGYEDDDAPATNGVKGNDATRGNAPLPLDAAATPVAMPTIESDIPTTDTALPADTAATSSRPASRAGSQKPPSRAASRASSRAGSQKPTSRNGSLAVPRAASRGRSRTPRGGSVQPMSAVAEEMEVVKE